LAQSRFAVPDRAGSVSTEGTLRRGSADEVSTEASDAGANKGLQEFCQGQYQDQDQDRDQEHHQAEGGPSAKVFGWKEVGPCASEDQGNGYREVGDRAASQDRPHRAGRCFSGCAKE
jgi:hypothetical protein